MSFDLDPVTWEAIAAIVGGLVFVVNLFLATSSWQMAKAANRQAVAASEQAEAAREQADAAASQADAIQEQSAASRELAQIARQDLEATSSAALQVMREGGRAVASYFSGTRGSSSRPSFGISIRNLGLSPASLRAASLQLPGVSGTCKGQANVDVLRHDEVCRIQIPVEERAVAQALSHGGVWQLVIPFREAGSDRDRRFTVQLNVTKEGDRLRFAIKRESSSRRQN